MRLPGLACAILLVACGDIKSTASDAGGGDGGSPDARAVGSVTVTVGKLFGSTQPLEGNQVVLVDTAGAIAADTTTDADGVATADGIEAGSTMIILFAQAPAGSSAGRQAVIVVGVEPGDDIHFDEENPSSPPVGNMNVTWPAKAGTNLYSVNTGCGESDTNDTIVNFSFDEECVVNGEAQALVRSADASDVTLGWLGGTVAFAQDGTLDIAGPWQDPKPLTVTLSDIPSEAQSVRPQLQPARGHVSFHEVSLPPVELQDPTVSVDMPLPPVFADSDLITLLLTPDQPGYGASTLAMRVTPDQAPLDLALADELLPWLGSPVLDVPSRTFSWTRSSGKEPDAQYLLMFWIEEGSDDQWLTAVVVPPELTSVTVPELPADYEQFLPIDPAQVGIQIQAGESSEVDGYRAARQIGVSLIYNHPVIGLDAPSTLRRSTGGEDF